MRVFVAMATALAIASCYDPQPRVGAPCSSAGACPAGIPCVDGFCVGGGRDASVVTDTDDAAPYDTVGWDSVPAFAVRINIAGPALDGVDHPGTWSSDPGAGGICDGGRFDSPTSDINGTSDDALFANQMFGTTLSCAVPNVPAGSYRVTLLFAELRLGGNPCLAFGNRIFDVFLEGALVEDDFNMTTAGGGCAAGGTGRAFDRSFTIDVVDGVLDFRGVASMGAAALNAIEVVAPP